MREADFEDLGVRGGHKVIDVYHMEAPRVARPQVQGLRDGAVGDAHDLEGHGPITQPDEVLSIELVKVRDAML